MCNRKIQIAVFSLVVVASMTSISVCAVNKVSIKDQDLIYFSAPVEYNADTKQQSISTIVQGADGKDGADGLSAYEQAKNKGYTGSEADYVSMLLALLKQNSYNTLYETLKAHGYTGTEDDIALAYLLADNTLNGVDGKDGIDGLDGRDGVDGKDGVDGVDGINGSDGVNGIDGKIGLNGVDGSDGLDGVDGVDGKNGTNGVAGTNGANGIDGKDGVDGIDGKDGVNGVDGKDGADGINGKSAYDLFVLAGYTDTEANYTDALYKAITLNQSDELLSVLQESGYTGTDLSLKTVLTGEKGDKGDTGEIGATGTAGTSGVVSIAGSTGVKAGITDSMWTLDNISTSTQAKAKVLSISPLGTAYAFYEDGTLMSSSTEANNLKIAKQGTQLTSANSADILHTTNTLFEMSDLASNYGLVLSGDLINYYKDTLATPITQCDLTTVLPKAAPDNKTLVLSSDSFDATAKNTIIQSNTFWNWDYLTNQYVDTGVAALGKDGVNGTNGKNGLVVGTYFTAAQYSALTPTQRSNCRLVVANASDYYLVYALTDFYLYSGTMPAGPNGPNEWHYELKYLAPGHDSGYIWKENYFPSDANRYQTASDALAAIGFIPTETELFTRTSHGWDNDGAETWYYTIRKAYVDKGADIVTGASLSGTINALQTTKLAQNGVTPSHMPAHLAGYYCYVGTPT